LSAVRDCFFDVFAATFHNWRPFLHPKPEDVPCRGDRNPLNTECNKSEKAGVLERFKALAAVLRKIQVSWGVTSYRLLCSYQPLGEELSVISHPAFIPVQCS
jgi:hypothetical protein